MTAHRWGQPPPHDGVRLPEVQSGWDQGVDARPTPVVIAGAGKLGKLLVDCLDGDERWRPVAFIDDGQAGETCFGLPIYASDAYDPALTRHAFMAIGYPAMRRQMVARLERLGLDWRTFVDRRAMVGRHAVLGRGTLVLNFATIASTVRTGEFCYVSTYGHLGTGSVMGDYCSVLPSAGAGETVIGNDCTLGVHSSCLDHAVLGDGVTVGPYALVRQSVPAGALVAGVPARIVRRDETAAEQPAG